MIECTEREIRDMLPDVVHGTMVPLEQRRVDAHLAVCDQCRAELKVLREVHGAAVFAPAIDVDRIVRQIPPYAGVLPVAERPARSRTVAWLAAASLAVLVAVGGSVLVAPSDVAQAPARAIFDPVVAAPATQSLALTAGVEELSDGGLEQLISELDGFDALPGADLDPLIDLETTSAVEQDSL
jgi:anti-sigma factor RsiW